MPMLTMYHTLRRGSIYCYVLCVVWIACILCISGTAARAGGWITKAGGVTLQDLEVVFFVDENSVTAVYYAGYHVDYENPTRQFVWLLPLAAEGVEQVGEYQGEWPWRRHFWGGWADEWLLPVRFTVPAKYCDQLYDQSQEPNSGDGGDQTAHAVIQSKPIVGVRELVGWLKSRNYVISEATQQRIAAYAENGTRQFLVLEMSQDGPYGVTPPVAITLPRGADPWLPLGFLAGQIDSRVPIQVWVLGAAPYSPLASAQGLTVDPRNLQAESRLFQPFSSDYNDQINNYPQERSRLIAAGSDWVFIKEYAGSSRVLMEKETGPADIVAHYPYLTKLYTELSPDNVKREPKNDPILGATTLEVSYQIDLRPYVDPLEYWGCSTRVAAQQVGSLAALPDGRGRIFDLTVAIPRGWMLSQFSLHAKDWPEPILVQAFARRPVDWHDFEAFRAGKPAPPMFIAYKVTYWEGWSPFEELSYFSDEADTDRLWQAPDIIRFIPDQYSRRGVYFAIWTNEADWGMHKALYRAMLRYADALPYYLHPKLPHTLFLDEAAVGFPEGWRERVEGDAVVIAPESGSSRVRIYRDKLPGTGNQGYWTDRLVEFVGTTCGQKQAAEVERILNSEHGCLVNIPLLTCEQEGRTGFIRISPYLTSVVEVSAAAAEFDAEAKVLKTIGESAQFSGGCG